MKNLFAILNPFEWGPLLAYQKRKRVEYYERCLHDTACARAMVRRYFPFIIKPRAKILDVGCGQGRITATFRQLGYSVTGIDKKPHPFWKKIGRCRAGDAHRLPFPAKSFDVCACFLVLEYVRDDRKVIREMRRVLKKNGKLVVQVANRKNLKTLIWGVYLDPLHKREYTSEEITALLQSEGFRMNALWTESTYLPIFPRFFGYVYWLVLSEKWRERIDACIPQQYRGVIHVICTKE